MKDLKKKSDIKTREDKDKKETDTETKRADAVVNDGGKIESADKKIDLKGTEDGHKDVTKNVKKAMDNSKKTHDKLDKDLKKHFAEMEDAEKDLGKRSDGMKSVSSLPSPLKIGRDNR